MPKKALEELGDYLINFTPYIFDLSGFDIANTSDKGIKPILYVFQHIWFLNKDKNSKESYEFLQRFFSLTKKLSKSHKKGYIIDIMADVLTYFHQYNPKLNKRTLKMASQEITKKLGGIDLMEAYDFTIKGAIKRGQQEGMQKGIQQLQEVALKLLEMGMNIDKVSQVTGLSKLKIHKLQVEAKK